MKKALTLLLTYIIVTINITAHIAASAFEVSENFKYYLKDGNALISGYSAHPDM